MSSGTRLQVTKSMEKQSALILQAIKECWVECRIKWPGMKQEMTDIMGKMSTMKQEMMSQMTAIIQGVVSTSSK